MCNKCECDNIDKCSIVGNIPLGFCCPKCNFYNEDHTCLNFKVKTQEKIKAMTQKIDMLRNAFEKKDSDEKIKEEELQKYP